MEDTTQKIPRLEQLKVQLQAQGVDPTAYSDERLVWELGQRMEREGKDPRSAGPEFADLYYNIRNQPKPDMKGPMALPKELWRSGKMATLGLGGSFLQAGAAASTYLPESLGEPTYDWLTTRAQSLQQASQKDLPTIVRPTDIRWDRPEEVARGLTSAFGQALPSLIQSLAVGGAAGKISRGAAKKLAQKIPEDELVSKKVGEGYTQIPKRQKFIDDVTMGGMFTGTALNSVGMNAGEIYSSLYPYTELPETHEDYVSVEDARAAAFTGGIISGAADSVLPATLLNKFFKQGGSGAKRYYQRFISTLPRNITVEGFTESFQELVNMMSEKYARGHDFTWDAMTADERRRLLDAGILGAVGGAQATVLEAAYGAPDPNIASPEELDLNIDRLEREAAENKRLIEESPQAQSTPRVYQQGDSIVDLNTGARGEFEGYDDNGLAVVRSEKGSYSVQPQNIARVGLGGRIFADGDRVKTSDGLYGVVTGRDGVGVKVRLNNSQNTYIVNRNDLEFIRSAEDQQENEDLDTLRNPRKKKKAYTTAIEGLIKRRAPDLEFIYDNDGALTPEAKNIWSEIENEGFVAQSGKSNITYKRVDGSWEKEISSIKDEETEARLKRLSGKGKELETLLESVRDIADEAFSPNSTLTSKDVYESVFRKHKEKFGTTSQSQSDFYFMLKQIAESDSAEPLVAYDQEQRYYKIFPNRDYPADVAQEAAATAKAIDIKEKRDKHDELQNNASVLIHGGQVALISNWDEKSASTGVFKDTDNGWKIEYIDPRELKELKDPRSQSPLIKDLTDNLRDNVSEGKKSEDERPAQTLQVYQKTLSEIFEIPKTADEIKSEDYERNFYELGEGERTSEKLTNYLNNQDTPKPWWVHTQGKASFHRKSSDISQFALNKANEIGVAVAEVIYRGKKVLVSLPIAVTRKNISGATAGTSLLQDSLIEISEVRYPDTTKANPTDFDKDIDPDAVDALKEEKAFAAVDEILEQGSTDSEAEEATPDSAEEQEAEVPTEGESLKGIKFGKYVQDKNVAVDDYGKLTPMYVSWAAANDIEVDLDTIAIKIDEEISKVIDTEAEPEPASSSWIYPKKNDGTLSWSRVSGVSGQHETDYRKDQEGPAKSITFKAKRDGSKFNITYALPAIYAKKKAGEKTPKRLRGASRKSLGSVSKLKDAQALIESNLDSLYKEVFKTAEEVAAEEGDGTSIDFNFAVKTPSKLAKSKWYIVRQSDAGILVVRESKKKSDNEGYLKDFSYVAEDDKRPEYIYTDTKINQKGQLYDPSSSQTNPPVFQIIKGGDFNELFGVDYDPKVHAKFGVGEVNPADYNEYEDENQSQIVEATPDEDSLEDLLKEVTSDVPNKGTISKNSIAITDTEGEYNNAIQFTVVVSDTGEVLTAKSATAESDAIFTLSDGTEYELGTIPESFHKFIANKVGKKWKINDVTRQKPSTAKDYIADLAMQKAIDIAVTGLDKEINESHERSNENLRIANQDGKNREQGGVPVGYMAAQLKEFVIRLRLHLRKAMLKVRLAILKGSSFTRQAFIAAWEREVFNDESIKKGSVEYQTMVSDPLRLFNQAVTSLEQSEDEKDKSLASIIRSLPDVPPYDLSASNRDQQITEAANFLIWGTRDPSSDDQKAISLISAISEYVSRVSDTYAKGEDTRLIEIYEADQDKKIENAYYNLFRREYNNEEFEWWVNNILRQEIIDGLLGDTEGDTEARYRAYNADQKSLIKTTFEAYASVSNALKNGIQLSDADRESMYNSLSPSGFDGETSLQAATRFNKLGAPWRREFDLSSVTYQSSSVDYIAEPNQSLRQIARSIRDIHNKVDTGQATPTEDTFISVIRELTKNSQDEDIKAFREKIDVDLQSDKRELDDLQREKEEIESEVFSPEEGLSSKEEREAEENFNVSQSSRILIKTSRINNLIESIKKKSEARDKSRYVNLTAEKYPNPDIRLGDIYGDDSIVIKVPTVAGHSTDMIEDMATLTALNTQIKVAGNEMLQDELNASLDQIAEIENKLGDPVRQRDNMYALEQVTGVNMALYGGDASGFLLDAEKEISNETQKGGQLERAGVDQEFILWTLDDIYSSTETMTSGTFSRTKKKGSVVGVSPSQGFLKYQQIRERSTGKTYLVGMYRNTTGQIKTKITTEGGKIKEVPVLSDEGISNLTDQGWEFSGFATTIDGINRNSTIWKKGNEERNIQVRETGKASVEVKSEYFEKYYRVMINPRQLGIPEGGMSQADFMLQYGDLWEITGETVTFRETPKKDGVPKTFVYPSLSAYNKAKLYALNLQERSPVYSTGAGKILNESHSQIILLRKARETEYQRHIMEGKSHQDAKDEVQNDTDTLHMVEQGGTTDAGQQANPINPSITAPSRPEMDLDESAESTLISSYEEKKRKLLERNDEGEPKFDAFDIGGTSYTMEEIVGALSPLYEIERQINLLEAEGGYIKQAIDRLPVVGDMAIVGRRRPRKIVKIEKGEEYRKVSDVGMGDIVVPLTVFFDGDKKGYPIEDVFIYDKSDVIKKDIRALSKKWETRYRKSPIAQAIEQELNLSSGGLGSIAYKANRAMRRKPSEYRKGYDDDVLAMPRTLSSFIIESMYGQLRYISGNKHEPSIQDKIRSLKSRPLDSKKGKVTYRSVSFLERFRNEINSRTSLWEGQGGLRSSEVTSIVVGRGLDPFEELADQTTLAHMWEDGDTLEKIGRKYNVSPFEILEANKYKFKDWDIKPIGDAISTGKDDNSLLAFWNSQIREAQESAAEAYDNDPNLSFPYSAQGRIAISIPKATTDYARYMSVLPSVNIRVSIEDNLYDDGRTKNTMISELTLEELNTAYRNLEDEAVQLELNLLQEQSNEARILIEETLEDIRNSIDGIAHRWVGIINGSGAHLKGVPTGNIFDMKIAGLTQTDGKGSPRDPINDPQAALVNFQLSEYYAQSEVNRLAARYNAALEGYYLDTEDYNRAWNREHEVSIQDGSRTITVTASAKNANKVITEEKYGPRASQLRAKIREAAKQDALRKAKDNKTVSHASAAHVGELYRNALVALAFRQTLTRAIRSPDPNDPKDKGGELHQMVRLNVDPRTTGKVKLQKIQKEINDLLIEQQQVRADSTHIEGTGSAAKEYQLDIDGSIDWNVKTKEGTPVAPPKVLTDAKKKYEIIQEKISNLVKSQETYTPMWGYTGIIEYIKNSLKNRAELNFLELEAPFLNEGLLVDGRQGGKGVLKSKAISGDIFKHLSSYQAFKIVSDLQDYVETFASERNRSLIESAHEIASSDKEAAIRRSAGRYAMGSLRRQLERLQYLFGTSGVRTETLEKIAGSPEALTSAVDIYITDGWPNPDDQIKNYVEVKRPSGDTVDLIKVSHLSEEFRNTLKQGDMLSDVGPNRSWKDKSPSYLRAIYEAWFENASDSVLYAIGLAKSKDGLNEILKSHWDKSSQKDALQRLREAGEKLAEVSTGIPSAQLYQGVKGSVSVQESMSLRAFLSQRIITNAISRIKDRAKGDSKRIEALNVIEKTLADWGNQRVSGQPYQGDTDVAPRVQDYINVLLSDLGDITGLTYYTKPSKKGVHKDTVTFKSPYIFNKQKIKSYNDALRSNLLLIRGGTLGGGLLLSDMAMEAGVSVESLHASNMDSKEWNRLHDAHVVRKNAQQKRIEAEQYKSLGSNMSSAEIKSYKDKLKQAKDQEAQAIREEKRISKELKGTLFKLPPTVKLTDLQTTATWALSALKDELTGASGDRAQVLSTLIGKKGNVDSYNELIEALEGLKGEDSATFKKRDLTEAEREEADNQLSALQSAVTDFNVALVDAFAVKAVDAAGNTIYKSQVDYSNITIPQWSYSREEYGYGDDETTYREAEHFAEDLYRKASEVMTETIAAATNGKPVYELIESGLSGNKIDSPIKAQVLNAKEIVDPESGEIVPSQDFLDANGMNFFSAQPLQGEIDRDGMPVLEMSASLTQSALRNNEMYSESLPYNLVPEEISPVGSMEQEQNIKALMEFVATDGQPVTLESMGNGFSSRAAIKRMLEMLDGSLSGQAISTILEQMQGIDSLSDVKIKYTPWHLFRWKTSLSQDKNIVGAVYNGDTRTIEISDSFRVNGDAMGALIYTLSHELMHPVVNDAKLIGQPNSRRTDIRDKYIRDNNISPDSVKVIQDAFTGIEKLFNHLKSKHKGKYLHGLSSIDEFIIESRLNPKFVEYLKGVRADKRTSKIRTAWDAVVDFFARIFAALSGRVGPADFESLKENIDILFSEYAKVNPAASETRGIQFSKVTNDEDSPSIRVDENKAYNNAAEYAGINEVINELGYALGDAVEAGYLPESGKSPMQAFLEENAEELLEVRNRIKNRLPVGVNPEELSVSWGGDNEHFKAQAAVVALYYGERIAIKARERASNRAESIRAQTENLNDLRAEADLDNVFDPAKQGAQLKSKFTKMINTRINTINSDTSRGLRSEYLETVEELEAMRTSNLIKSSTLSNILEAGVSAGKTLTGTPQEVSDQLKEVAPNLPPLFNKYIGELISNSPLQVMYMQVKLGKVTSESRKDALKRIAEYSSKGFVSLQRLVDELEGVEGLDGKLKYRYAKLWRDIRQTELDIESSKEKAEQSNLISNGLMPLRLRMGYTVGELEPFSMYDGASMIRMSKDEDSGEWLASQYRVKLNNKMLPEDIAEFNDVLASNQRFLADDDMREQYRNEPYYQALQRQTRIAATAPLRNDMHEAAKASFFSTMQAINQQFADMGPVGVSLSQMSNMIMTRHRANAPYIKAQSGRWTKYLKEASESLGYKDWQEFLEGPSKEAIYYIENQPQYTNQPEKVFEEMWSHMKAYGNVRDKTLMTDKAKGIFFRYMRESIKSADMLSRTSEAEGNKVEAKYNKEFVVVRSAIDGSPVNLMRKPIKTGAITVTRRLNRNVSSILEALQRAKWTSIQPPAEDEDIRNYLGKYMTDFVVSEFVRPYARSVAAVERFYFNKMPIPQSAVRSAWYKSKGVGIDRYMSWIENLATDMKVDGNQLALQIFGRLRRMREHLVKAAESADGENIFKISGAIQHKVMDSRDLKDILPKEFYQYDSFDEVSSNISLAVAITNSAMGRGGDRYRRLKQRLEADLKEKQTLFGEIIKEAGGVFNANSYKPRLAYSRGIKRAAYAALKRRGYKSNFKEKFNELRSAALQLRQSEQAFEQFEGYLGGKDGPYQDVRWLTEALGLQAFLILSQPKSAMLNFLSIPDIMLFSRGLNKLGIKGTAKAVQNLFDQAFGGAMNSLGINIWRAHQYSEDTGEMFYHFKENELPFRDFVYHVGLRGSGKSSLVDRSLTGGFGPIPGIKGISRIGRRAPAGVENPTRAPLTLRTMLPFVGDPFGWTGRASNHSIGFGLAANYHDLVQEAAQYIEDNNIPKEHELTAKELGWGSGIGGVGMAGVTLDRLIFGGEAGWNNHNAKLVEAGIGSITQLAHDYIDRRKLGDNRVLTKDTTIAIAQIGLNEVALDGFLARPSWLYTNLFGRIASPLLGWGLARMNQVNQFMRTEEGRLSAVLLMKYLILLSGGIIPIGLMMTMMQDLWDDDVLGKPNALGSISKSQLIPFIGMFTNRDDPDYNALAAIERMGRSSSPYGIAYDAFAQTVAMADPYSSARGFSFDRRILFLSQIQNLLGTLHTIASQGGKMDYASVGRPLIYTMGGNAYFHMHHALTNAMGLDTHERRIADIIGMKNEMRSSAKAEGLNLKRAAPFGVMPTELSMRVKQMEVAAYAGDTDAFRDAYAEAVDAARKDGKQDPEGYVVSRFKERTLRRRVTSTKLQDQDWQKLLDGMSPEMREKVLQFEMNREKYLGILDPEPIAYKPPRRKSTRQWRREMLGLKGSGGERSFRREQLGL